MNIKIHFSQFCIYPLKSFNHFFSKSEKLILIMNKTDTKLPCPPPIIGLRFNTARKEIISPASPDRFPQTARIAPRKSHTATKKQPQQLEPMTSRPRPPDSIMETEEESNPRFRFFIPPTYQPKNLPPRISPVVSNAPIDPNEAIKKYSTLLTPYEVTEILDFPEVYFVGFKNKKNDINLSDLKSFGFDDFQNGYYKVQPGDHIIYRFEVQSLIGQGKHGQVYKCLDHKLHQQRAVKMIANTKRSPTQSKVEMTILSRLKKLHPEGIETAQIYFLFRQHMFVTFNILSKDVSQLMKLNNISTLSPRLVKCVAMDVINQMKDYQSVGVTLHGQILPENILLVPETNAEFRLIDFSNSILERNIPKDYEFEVPKSYMPPEAILGMEVGEPFDMWCLGCLLVYLTTGKQLFEASDDANVLNEIIGLIGLPNDRVKKKIPAAKRQEFFDKSTGGIKKNLLGPSSTPKKEPSVNLKMFLNTDDQQLVDFLTKIFTWDPDDRITVDQAARLPYIADVDSRYPEPYEEEED